MSSVFLSYDVTGSCPVAVKLLADHLAHSHEFVGRFYREARLSRLLAHPNLVRGLGAGFDQVTAKHYLILEYIDGPTAHTALTRLGRFPVGVAVRIGLDIARALAFLHSRQYVHRDVKPDNILLHPDGIAKLADLGLAKRLNDDPQLTTTSHGVGTSYYMAYEQALNANLVDGRSDLFALGATLYHLLTGQVPFPGATHEEVVREKEQNTFRPLRELNPEIPAVLADTIAATLARDPRARFQSAAELAAALEATNLATRIPPFPQSDGATGPGTGPETATRADLWVHGGTGPTALAGPPTPPVPPVPPTESFTAVPGWWSSPPRSHSGGLILRPRLMAGVLAGFALASLATGAVLGARAVFAPPGPEPEYLVVESPEAPPTDSHPTAVPQ
jgi:serine/threonine-protein kinase